MGDKPISLRGNDIAVLIGELSLANNIRVTVKDAYIVLYKPRHNIVVREGMRLFDFSTSLPLPYEKRVDLPFDAVRQLLVNNNPVWQNRAIYPDASEVKGYLGTGNVVVELNNQYAGIGKLVETMLASNIGLERSE